MKEKYVEIKKQSKKTQKAYYAQQRLTWGNVNPASRVEPDRKKFRKAARSRDKASLRGCSFFALSNII